jgi:hypothetical protein
MAVELNPVFDPEELVNQISQIRNAIVTTIWRFRLSWTRRTRCGFARADVRQAPIGQRPLF